MEHNLKDRVAIVTGGSRGIGRAISLRLAAQGARVAIFYAGNTEAAKRTATDIRDAGGTAMVRQVDVSSTSAATEAVEAVVKDWDRLDILVNNAGITRDQLILRMKEEDWDAVLNTNLKGAFNMARAGLKALLKAKSSGRIINVSSVVGEAGNPGQANYVASKAGLIGLTKSLALEVARRGVTVNAVAPGFITTDMTAELPEKTVEELKSRIPLGRLGAPEDIAAAVAYLAGDHGGYITGQVLRVNGGMYM
jgi:3-oxoacyl-[acyl-carrier protein] reductase